MKHKKYYYSILFFVALVGLTVFFLVRQSNFSAVLSAISRSSPVFLALGALLALFFVFSEAVAFFLLLRALQHRVSLWLCFRWSLIGFFFSGITPSTSGGQPAQIYYMRKKGIPAAQSTPITLLVTAQYNAATALCGLILLLTNTGFLRRYFGGYIGLFYLGIIVHLLLVAGLLFMILQADSFLRLALSLQRLCVRLRLLRTSQQREDRLRETAKNYRQCVRCFRQNPAVLCSTGAISFLRRLGTLLLTGIVYRAMGLTAESLTTVVFIQAAVCISVEIIPLPGSVGITELVYSVAFAEIFTGDQLAASLCITRGLGFYLPLLLGLGALGIELLYHRSPRINQKTDN